MTLRTIITLTACLVVGTACAGGMRHTSSSSGSSSSGSGGTSAYSTGSPSAASSSARASSLPAFETLDSNHDGVISTEEANRQSVSRQIFTRMDRDSDGQLSRVEYDSGGALSEGASESNSGSGSDGTGGSGGAAGGAGAGGAGAGSSGAGGSGSSP